MLDCCCWHGVSCLSVCLLVFFLLLSFIPHLSISISLSFLDFCRRRRRRRILSNDKVADTSCCMCVKTRSLLLLVLISRSKLVPDFALTLHFMHLIATSLYSRSVPRNWLWWALQVASASLMISLGIWSCRWRELKPINFGGGVAAGGGEGKSEAAAGELLGEEGGVETGLGGEYEMVGINKGGGGS